MEAVATLRILFESKVPFLAIARAVELVICTLPLPARINCLISCEMPFQFSEI